MAAEGEQKDENRLVKIDLDDAGNPRRGIWVVVTEIPIASGA